jgi:hypothetical protein
MMTLMVPSSFRAMWFVSRLVRDLSAWSPSGLRLGEESHPVEELAQPRLKNAVASNQGKAWMNVPIQLRPALCFCPLRVFMEESSWFWI